MMLARRRYIVNRNHQEGEKDAADRRRTGASALQGDKALVGNTAFRRYLKTISDENFAIDPDIGSASSRTHDDDRLRLPPAAPACNSSKLPTAVDPI